jgi:hypothetical protein
LIEVSDVPIASENIQMLCMTQFAQEQGPTAFLVDGLLNTPKRSLGFGMVHATLQAIVVKKTSFWTAKQYVILGPSGKSRWTGYEDGLSLYLTKDKGLVGIPDESIVQFVLQDENNITLSVM